MLIATSSLAFLACQGCIGTMAQDSPADVPLQTFAKAAPVSDGLRLATDGAFSGDIAEPAPYRTGATTLFLGPEQTGPTLSASVDLVNTTGNFSPWINNAFSVNGPSPSLTNLEWSNNDAVQVYQGSLSAARLLQPVMDDKSFKAEFAFAASRQETGLAFDLNLVPSISYEEEGKFATRSVGAEIRLGRDFDQRGTGAVADSWYIFAGTEGEALVWEAGEYGFSNVTGAMALRDQVTVGDLQAGVSIQRGLGQLSLSYIRREVEWRDRNGGASTDEDFAGLSFTLKR
ncbi:MAG: hypothetical protein AAGI03_11810 [Pseudomonadota bacterium]